MRLCPNSAFMDLHTEFCVYSTASIAQPPSYIDLSALNGKIVKEGGEMVRIPLAPATVLSMGVAHRPLDKGQNLARCILDCDDRRGLLRSSASSYRACHSLSPVPTGRHPGRVSRVSCVGHAGPLSRSVHTVRYHDCGPISRHLPSCGQGCTSCACQHPRAGSSQGCGKLVQRLRHAWRTGAYRQSFRASACEHAGLRWRHAGANDGNAHGYGVGEVLGCAAWKSFCVQWLMLTESVLYS